MPDESPGSYTKGARLTPEEIRILDELDIPFSDIVHEAIEKKQKKAVSKSRQQKVQKAAVDGVFLIIGIAFIWTLNFASGSLISIAIVASMGIGFAVLGGFGLYRGMKAEGIIVRKK